MAQKTAVEKLLEKAKLIEPKNEVLTSAIDALVANVNAKGTSVEFKNLQKVIEDIKAGNDTGETGGGNNDSLSGSDNEAKAKAEAEAEAKAKAEAEAEAKVAGEPKKKINQDGTRMIGAMYYNKKDDYKKGFPTANECSLHHNGYRE